MKHVVAIDAALVGTILIWAVNFSVVKLVLGHLEPLAFNTVRLVCASLIFLALARLFPGPSILPRDGVRLLALGLVGHTSYQLLFIHGLDRTTASNTAIFLGLAPVFVAILGALFSVEAPSARGCAGIAMSVLGVYLVLHDSVRLGGSPRGDWLTLGAMLCWSIYTVAGKSVVARYGLFKSNAYTMALGTLFFLPFGARDLLSVSVATVPPSAWWGTAFSFLFALVIAYCSWYFAVSRVGPTQTAVYLNLMPVVAVAIAHFWLGERVGTLQIIGAVTILTGIYLVRTRPRGSLDQEGRSR